MVASFLDAVDDGKTKKKRVVGVWWWLIVGTWKAERKRLRFRNLGISILFCVWEWDNGRESESSKE
jgi:hypothetical protein